MNIAILSSPAYSGFDLPGGKLRLVSPAAALVGGLLSIAACVLLHCGLQFDLQSNTSVFWGMAAIWPVTLLLMTAINIHFISRNARLLPDALTSSRLKFAASLILPAFVCGVFFTVTAFIPQMIYLFVIFQRPAIWMICYGVGLLSTLPLAPRSIILLGWSFLLTGFFSYSYVGNQIELDSESEKSLYVSNVLMGATFGLFHLIYAACTWPRKTSGADALAAGGQP